MAEPTNTVRLHRVLRAPPERLYRAFVDPDAMVKRIPRHGFIGKIISSSRTFRMVRSDAASRGSGSLPPGRYREKLFAAVVSTLELIAGRGGSRLGAYEESAMPSGTRRCPR